MIAVYFTKKRKIISKNTFESKNNIDGKTKIIARRIASIGVENSRGRLTTKIIDNYKSESDNFFVKFVPTKIYCLGGYWIEKFQPGRFESMFFEAIEEVVEETYQEIREDLENNINNLINDFNKGYKSLQEEFNNIFN